jgi:hypothetical protein
MLAGASSPRGLDANLFDCGCIVGRLSTARYLTAVLPRVLPMGQQV